MVSPNSSRRRVLVFCSDGGNGREISKLFTSTGFDVDFVIGQPYDFDGKYYGAIVYVGRADDFSGWHLGEPKPGFLPDVWPLFQGYGEDEVGCIAQLAERAAADLRMFIRLLWARANMT